MITYDKLYQLQLINSQLDQQPMRSYVKRLLSANNDFNKGV